MNPAVDAIDNEKNPLTHLVTGEPLGQNPSGDPLCGPPAMTDILA